MRTVHARRFVSILAMTGILGVAIPAGAQIAAPAGPALKPLDTQRALTESPRSPWKSLFTNTTRDYRNLATRNTMDWLTIGAGAALVAQFGDIQIGHALSSSPQLRESGRPGQLLGSTPFQLGAAAATLAIGHMANKPRVAHVGGDLIRAQLMAEVLAIGIKQAVKRSRPEGSGYSFPSGHTTVSFASATVLQRHFGWRAGIPAYAVAGYIAVSRVEMRRHYLSDVAFGAALGIIAGRTITLGHAGHAFQVAPVATPGGAAVSFTWTGR